MPRTVFILGAGASKEINLPTGDQLTEKIAYMCDFEYRNGLPVRGKGDLQLMDALRQHPQLGDVNANLRAAWRIRDGMPLAASIDNFLDAHRADERVQLVGKLAIVLAILAAEKNSNFYRDPTRPDVPLAMTAVGSTWYKWFWRLLCDECTSDRLAARGQTVTFVVFNYDRCIEQFLLFAARAYYAMDDKTAAQAVSTIRVLHPYGVIAPLPWQNNREAVEYGTEAVAAAQLLELSRGVQTFTESAQGERIGQIRAAVDAAELIVFLGFAYHRQNMRLLWPASTQNPARTRRVYGTTKGFSESDRQLITWDIESLAGIDRNQITLADKTCADLFHEYSRSLSLLA
jgi:hypothetical protein